MMTIQIMNRKFYILYKEYFILKKKKGGGGGGA